MHMNCNRIVDNMIVGQIVLLTIFVSFGCTCKGDQDYVYTMKYTLVNDSGHTVGIEAPLALSREMQSVVLSPGDRISIVESSEMGIVLDPMHYIGSTYYVLTFDGIITAEHVWRDCTYPEKCPCLYDAERYVYRETGKRSKTMTYTFTDADYDYAVSRQTEIPVAYESLYK